MQKSRLIVATIVVTFLPQLFLFGNSHNISPLFFEPNQNRFVPDVKYFAITPQSISIGCYKNALVFYLPESNQYFRVLFPNGITENITGEIPLQSHSTYIKGNHSFTVFHYKAVHYKEIYPGIDLYLYFKNEQFKFDFIIHPFSNVEDISLQVEILDTTKHKWVSIPTRIEGDTIHLNHKNTYLSFQAPCAFQWIEGKSQLVPVYLYEKDGIKFSLDESSYNPAYPVLLDPTLLAGTYLGGNNTDRIIDVDIDGAGNIYLVGETKSVNFPTSSGVFQNSFFGGDITGDIFITKLNPLANTLIFSTFLGGSGDESPTAIKIDEQRNIYITGITSSSDFPITSNAFQTSKIGNRDAFISKINSDGTGMIYSSYIGGSADESVMDFTFLSDRSLILTGWTQSNNFPVMGDSALNQIFSGGGLDGFLIKFSSSFLPIWSGYIGSTGIDICKTIENFMDNIIVGGYTSSSNFPTTSSAFQITYNGGNYDGFIMKLSGENGTIINSTYLGGSLIDICHSLTCDSFGNIYITGETSSNNFPITISSFQVGYGGGERDTFITKMSPNLSQIIFSSYLGGSKTEVGLGIALDSFHRPYVVGYTYSGDYPVIPGTLQPSYGGNQDAFFSCLSPNGNTLQYSTYYGGKGEEKARSVYISPSNVMYIVGETASNLLPITSGTFQTSFGGGTLDGFLACIDVTSSTTEGEGQAEGIPEGTTEGTAEGEGLRVWLIAPIERTVNEGANTTFIIGVSGYVGTVNYQWQFKNIVGEEYIPIPSSNSPMLTLRNITSLSAGFYRCRVSDSLGTVISQSFKLIVITGSEGSPEGTIEGDTEGITEGIEEGSTDGIQEGIVDGSVDGNTEGIVEGSVLEGEGTLEEGQAEGEGSYYPCGFEISGLETHSPLRDMSQNLYYIYVSEDGILHDIIVNISITHDDLKQILIQLVSPLGTEVFLLIYPSQGGTQLLNTYFDDNAEKSILDGVSPFTGYYKPMGYLGVLKGEILKGKWLLRIVD